MAFNGSGTFVRLYDWTTDRDAGTKIRADRMDGEDDGFATGLSNCITKDGQTVVTANLPMATFKFTGLGAGSAATDSVNLRQVQANAYGYVASDTGSANAYVIAPSPAIAAYVAGQRFSFISANSSTGASTLNVNSLGVKAVEYQSAALTGAEIKATSLIVVEYDGTAFQMISPSNYIQTEKGGDIASANPLVIDTDGDYFDVTGTANFASMTVAADRQFTLQFDGVLTMTHHATNLDLPGEANVTTAAGDVAVFQSTGANTVQCIAYTKADGTAIVAAAGGGPGKGTAPSTVYRTNAKVQNENIVMSDHLTTATSTHATNVLNVGTDDDFANDNNVRLTTSGSDLPNGWAIDTDYYVIGATSSTMQLAATVGGAAVTISDNGTGTHTVFEVINAQAVGPIIIKTGNSLTIPSGSRVVII